MFQRNSRPRNERQGEAVTEFNLRVTYCCNWRALKINNLCTVQKIAKKTMEVCFRWTRVISGSEMHNVFRGDVQSVSPFQKATSVINSNPIPTSRQRPRLMCKNTNFHTESSHEPFQYMEINYLYNGVVSFSGERTAVENVLVLNVTISFFKRWVRNREIM